MNNYKKILVSVIVLVFTMVVIPKAAFSKTVTIKKIDNISVSIQKGAKFNLPAKVKAIMSTNKAQNVVVKWTPKTVTTAKAGTFTYNGIVIGYSKKVILSLKITEAKSTPAPETTTPATNDKDKDKDTSSSTPKPSPKPSPTPADGVSGATVDATE